MTVQSVRRRCERLLADVPVPEPFDVQAFADTVASRRQRSLRLVAKRTTSGPCGVWLALPGADYVFYEPATSALHRDHIILHELGHLLWDHGTSEPVADAVLAELMPNLDVAMVRRVLGRTTYSAVEEQEAEMVATLLLQRASRTTVRRPDVPVGADGDVLARIQDTLGGGHGRR